MQITPKAALPFPDASDAPDGPGAIYALATKLDGILGGSNWQPLLGGTGASGGANPAGDGSYLRIGRLAFFSGRIVFGASASFGTGTAAIINFPFGLDMNHATGKGHFQQVDGSGNLLGNPIPVFLTGGSGSSMQIRPIVANGSSPSTGPTAGAIGTPAQSSYLIFDVTAIPA